MVASAPFAAFLREQLASLGRVSLPRMFRVVADDVLYVRVDDGNREFFQEAATAPPLSYQKQGRTIDLAFWRAPERLYDEPEELLTWARLALAAAGRVAARRR